jgi:TldD protein
LIGRAGDGRTCLGNRDNPPSGHPAYFSIGHAHPVPIVLLAEKGDLLEGVTRTMREHGADLAEAGHRIWDTRKWFVSSEGTAVDQHIVECGAAMSATAVGENETQRRSYPGIRGQYGTRGWELVRELDRRNSTDPRGAGAADRRNCPSLDTRT